MSEKLCLQWNDFKENITTSFRSLRNEKEFSDVTLVCEDGEQVEAHRVILAVLSPLFQRILKRNNHPHPMIYLRGLKSQDLVAMIDFLYFGEADVSQESLDSFLALAEEMELKGLTGQKAADLFNDDITNSEPLQKGNAIRKEEKSQRRSSNVTFDKSDTAIMAANQLVGDFETLDVKVKSMMEKGNNMVQAGKNKTSTYVCKVCGKEGHPSHIKNHIERNHLEGISVPCPFCDKVFHSRNSMQVHKSVDHKNRF